MSNYKYSGPEPIDLGGGNYRCPVESCDKGPDGTPYERDTALGIKQHLSRSHPDVRVRINKGEATANGQADEMFRVMAKVTQALVSDRPQELYERMEEIVEIRKHVARYIGKRIPNAASRA